MDEHAMSDRRAEIREMTTRLARHIKQMERADRVIPLRRPGPDPHADGAGRLTGLVP